MKDTLKKPSSSPTPFLLVGLAWAVYSLLSIAQHHVNAYKLDNLQTTLLQLTIIIPLLLIWETAIYGAVRFRRYADLIKRSPDGRALGVLTSGLTVLVFSFIIQNFLSVLRGYAVGSTWLSPVVFLNNHLPILLALIAVSLLYRGSIGLSRIVKTPLSSLQLLSALVPFTIFASLYSAFFYSHIGHTETYGIPNFALPGTIPFFTMAIPYLVVWLLSVLAMLNVTNYIRFVKGAIYKRALKYLAAGIVAVLSFTILLQILTLTSVALLHLSLGLLLVIIYALLILYAVGFALIAFGARKLTAIEAVA